MKRTSSLSFLLKYSTAAVITCVLIVFSLTTLAQDETAAAEAASPLIDFTSIQRSDLSVSLKAVVKAKINGSLTKISGMPITFYRTTVSASTGIRNTVTDGSGVALVHISNDQLQTDQEGKLHFKVVVKGNKEVEAGEEVLDITRGFLRITPFREDSVMNVRLQLVDLSSGAETPVAETDLNLYVKRTFSNLKIGEGKTDENGEAVIEIPAKLPGNAKGELTLVGRLDESEDFGPLEAEVIQPWGMPISDKLTELPRALWSTHPPVWMLITFIILMTTVWGHYIVIVYELFRLRKDQA